MASGKTFRKSWADMHSDDSSMGANLPSLVKRKDENGSGSLQIPKAGSTISGNANSFSVVCDDSYACGGIENKKANTLNSSMKNVQISNGGGDFSCFGFLLPKSDETFDADTRSRMLVSAASNGGMAASSEESRLGKRLLSAVSGGHSDFSSIMMEHGSEHNTNQASKLRKLEEPVDGAEGARHVATSYNASESLLRVKQHSTNISSRHTGDHGATIEGDDGQWEARFLQRERQIELTKAGHGYQNYRKKVPQEKRNHNDPSTPNSRDMCSKRQFDGKLLKWRKQLKQYDDNQQ